MLIAEEPVFSIGGLKYYIKFIFIWTTLDTKNLPVYKNKYLLFKKEWHSRFVCFQCSSVAFDLGNWKDSKELILMLLGMIEFLIDQKT